MVNSYKIQVDKSERTRQLGTDGRRGDIKADIKERMRNYGQDSTGSWDFRCRDLVNSFSRWAVFRRVTKM
jgi:hypothetical protein